MIFFLTMTEKRHFSRFSPISSMVTYLKNSFFEIYGPFYILKTVSPYHRLFYKKWSRKIQATVTRERIDISSKDCTGVIYPT